MSECFLEPKSSREKVKDSLVLSTYATKADLKNATGVDISKSAKRIDSASLKYNIDYIRY